MSDQQAQPSEQTIQRVAGVMLLHAGKLLLIRRAAHGDHAGKWAFPGGKIEDGETEEQAAIRECHEEIGHKPSGKLSQVSRTDKHGADFTTFVSSIPDELEPSLNAEHDAFHWATVDEASKMDLHPGVAELLGAAQDARQDAAETELDIAVAIRDGKLESPQKYGNITMFDLRISGTGVSYRKRFDEYVFRNPDLYLNDEFLTRCQGLPVILEHPKADALNSKEFSDRIIGTILLPYIKGTEVWGIAKVYDDAAAQIMSKNQLSTSPAVVFRDPADNEKMELGDGNHLLIEGKPSLLDHLAVVEQGVWDKGGKPSGVKSSNINETGRADSADPNGHNSRSKNMADLNPEAQAKKDGEGAVSLESLMAAVQALASKIDRLESAEAAEVAAKPDGESMPTGEQVPAAAAVPDNAVASPNIAAVEKRVDALEAKTAPVGEEEAAKMADAQCKADAVYQAFGDQAPRPMMGESLMAYRKRLVAKMQPHSMNFKSVNLAAISDSAAIDAIEKMVYADALQVAQAPAVIADGVLIESVHTDETGRRIKEFKGSPSAWTNMFKAPRSRLIGIKTNHTAH